MVEPNETVHYTRYRSQLAFEVSVDSDELLSQLLKIAKTTDTLSRLVGGLIATIQVLEEKQDR